MWVWRDTPRTEAVVDAKLNRVFVRAEQEAAVIWHGCRQVGALADLGC